MTPLHRRLDHRTLSVPSVVIVPSRCQRIRPKPVDEKALPGYTLSMSQNPNLLLALALLISVAVGF